jgi:hypothetical protein
LDETKEYNKPALPDVIKLIVDILDEPEMSLFVDEGRFFDDLLFSRHASLSRS